MSKLADLMASQKKSESETPKKNPFANLGKGKKDAKKAVAETPGKNKNESSKDDRPKKVETPGNDSEAGDGKNEIGATEVRSLMPGEESVDSEGVSFEGAKDFRELLDMLPEILPNADILSQAIRQIMIELQENPQYEQQIEDDDIQLMIRGMRDTLHGAQIQKASKKRGSSSKASKALPEDIAMIESMLGGGS